MAKGRARRQSQESGDVAPLAARPRVALVAPHGLCRDLLERALRSERRLELVATLEPFELSAISGDVWSPDIIIVDATGPAGRDLVRTFADFRPKRHFVLVDVSDAHVIDAAAAGGVVGFATLAASYQTFIDSLLRAAHGEVVWPSDVAAVLMSAVRRAQIAPETDRLLTSRESAVMTLVAEGLTNKDIARSLAISISTVKTHIHIIFEKLDAKTRTEAAAKFRSSID